MRILIIDDDDIKYNVIAKALTKIYPDVELFRETARNSGILAVKEAKADNKIFDVIITDNYMPIYEDSHELKPCANRIVSSIRRILDSDIPICVCSSEEVEDCEDEYFIQFDISTDMDSKFHELFEELSENIELV